MGHERQPNTAADGNRKARDGRGLGHERQPDVTADGNGKRAALDGCPLSVYWVWMDFWWGEMWI